jgi:hypothetical protein
MQSSTMKRKSKMKLNLKARLRNWLLRDEESECVPADVIVHGPERINHENSINFQVIQAAGGRIVQVQTYDRHKDRHMTSLHIITPEEDLAESLAHILTLSQLSR